MSLRIWFAIGLSTAIALGGYKVGTLHWKGRYEALEAQGWRSKAQSEEIARKTLEAALHESHRIQAYNAKVINDLESQKAAISADSDRIRAQLRGLRLSTPRPAACSGPVSETPGEPGATSAGGDEGDGGFSRLASAAIDECRGNAVRFNSVIEQITPQLASP